MTALNSIKALIILLFILLASMTGRAQNVVFSAVAGASKMGIQDQVQVQYTIKDAADLKTMNPKPEIHNDFYIVGGPYQSQSSQFYNSNGRMTQSVSLTLTYVLQPKRKGRLTVAAAVATTERGETYQSNSITIEVVDGSLAQRQQQQRSYDPFADDPFEALMRQRQRQMQQHAHPRQAEPEPANVNIEKDLFIKVVVDKNKVHVGEQITASYKLYARLPMNVNISKLPSLNGFWTQDFDMPKGKITPVEEVVNGQRYQVFTLKKSALFPQQTGTLELDPAEAEGVARIVQKTKQRDPFFDDPFFSSFFMDDPMMEEFFGRASYKDVKVKLKSQPVKIQVDALPEAGKPGSFTNAVGNFSITSEIDKTELTTDDVANLKLVINGSGNIKLIEPPVLKLPNGLVAYDPQMQDTITGRTTAISGSKTITYAITPRTPGDYDIPALSFSYFNPQSGQYITLTTKPVKLRVKAGKGYSASSKRKTTLTDIHSINSKPLDDISFISKPLIHTPGYWAILSLPLFAYIGIIVWKRRDDELAKDSVQLRHRRANKIALKRLSTAQAFLQQNKRPQFYEEISKAIWLYLSDKLNIPLSALSKDNVWDALNNKNISKEMQAQVSRVIEDCEISLYSGSGGSQQMNQTYTDAVAVISKLEESFK